MLIDIDDEVLAKFGYYPGPEPDPGISSRVTAALRDWLAEGEASQPIVDDCERASPEEMAELTQDFLRSIRESRNKPPAEELSEEERKRMFLELQGSLAGPEGDAFAARVAAMRNQPWR